MNIGIGPGREGDPTLYIDNYPVAEVFDVDKMNVLLQRLERYEKALKDTRTEVWDEYVPATLSAKVHRIVEEALKE